MKKILVQSIVMILFPPALSMSTSVTADTNKPDENNSSHTEKKIASEYWANFEQDSEQTWLDRKSAFRDGWIESKLGTALALNKQLNPYTIDVRVNHTRATLEGEVNSDIAKELAQNIALAIEGIDSVTNKINVVQEPAKLAMASKSNDRDFAQYISDITTTAAIKTELSASKNIEALKIQVDTLNDKVTLSGEVKSPEEKALAQAIAAKQNDVKDVVNNLQIKS